VANPEAWNYPELKWTSKQAALARMKEGERPGLVVLKGEWCPHCRQLSKVFSDPEIAELSGSFELILLDSETEDAAAYEGTGSYVPRTLFLRPDGSIDTSLTAPNPNFPHFFSVRDKSALGDAMQTAIHRYGS
jgi:thiol-disulfide isomerase/thioredoxin